MQGHDDLLMRSPRRRGENAAGIARKNRSANGCVRHARRSPSAMRAASRPKAKPVALPPACPSRAERSKSRSGRRRRSAARRSARATATASRSMREACPSAQPSREPRASAPRRAKFRQRTAALRCADTRAARRLRVSLPPAPAPFCRWRSPYSPRHRAPAAGFGESRSTRAPAAERRS